MNTLTKLALGLMGHNKPRPVPGAQAIKLPRARRTGGMGLMEALARRSSAREFDAAELDKQTLSDLLWATAGVNRPKLGGRTAPSALNAQEVCLYAATAQGLFHYEPAAHTLQLAQSSDVRRVTGYQDFVDTAPLDLIFVADHSRMKLIPAAQRERYAYAAAGAMMQNAYLFCASNGLATVVRAWFDHAALSSAMGLQADQQLLLCQTVGKPQSAG